MGNPFKKIGDTFRRLPEQIPNPIPGKGGNVPSPGNVLEDIKDLPEEALDEIPKLVEEAFEALIKEAQRGVFKKAVQILESEVPDSVSISIGPIRLAIPSVGDKLDTIRKWAKNPPSNKSDVRVMIIEIAPETVSITLSAELALVLVASSSLSVGMTMTWETDKFLTRFTKVVGQL